MSSRGHTISRNTTRLVAAVLLGALPGHASARGRSFPIEVTGTIINVNRSKTEFTIQVDEPAGILTIGIGRDCKFKQNSTLTGERILKKGTRVKVSYFSTIFTGKIAVEIEFNPRPLVKTGIIEKIDRASRKLTIRLMDHSGLAMRWAVNAHFVRRGRKSSSANLRENAPVRVSYYSPAFAAKYAVRIELGQEF